MSIFCNGTANLRFKYDQDYPIIPTPSRALLGPAGSFHHPLFYLRAIIYSQRNRNWVGRPAAKFLGQFRPKFCALDSITRATQPVNQPPTAPGWWRLVGLLVVPLTAQWIYLFVTFPFPTVACSWHMARKERERINRLGKGKVFAWDSPVELQPDVKWQVRGFGMLKQPDFSSLLKFHTVLTRTATTYRKEIWTVIVTGHDGHVPRTVR